MTDDTADGRRTRSRPEQLTDAVREQAERVGAKAREAAEEGLDIVRERAAYVSAKAQDAYHTARDAAEEGLDEAGAFMKRQLRERPLAVAGVALGLGVLIGLALKNGRR